MVKPCASLLARLNSISESYAFHFVTGENILTGCYAGAKRVFPEPHPTSAVAIKDYLMNTGDVNAMRAGLNMLLSALSHKGRT